MGEFVGEVIRHCYAKMFFHVRRTQFEAANELVATLEVGSELAAGVDAPFAGWCREGAKHHEQTVAANPRGGSRQQVFGAISLSLDTPSSIP